MSTTGFSLDQLTLLRPEWLWALAPVLFAVWVLARHTTGNGPWRQVIDGHLLKALCGDTDQGPLRWPAWLAGLVGGVAVLALAGPAWDKQSAPLLHNTRATVIVLGLSQSMLSVDLKPNRLTRARFKIRDLVDALADREVGLVSFARDAFVVSPLTDDGNNIKNLLAALHPNIMPRQGSKPETGIRKAVELMEQAGDTGGDILLVADGVTAAALAAAQQAQARGFRTSVLAVGSEQGAPIATGGQGFLKDRKGDIVIPRLDREGLRRLAAAGGGRFVRMRVDQSDIEALTRPLAEDVDMGAKERAKTEQWNERGPWLVLLLLPLAALGFRRGWLFGLLLLIPLPRAQALDWAGMWARPDQRVHQALRHDQAKSVVGLQKDITDQPALAGSLAYRNGDYQAAAKAFSRDTSAQGHYNLGNALARVGKLDQAIEAYQTALKADPDLNDAQANLDLLKKMRQQQQQQKQKQGNSGNQGKKSGKNASKSQGRKGKPGQQAQPGKPRQDQDHDQATGQEKQQHEKSQASGQQRQGGKDQQPGQEKQQEQHSGGAPPAGQDPGARGKRPAGSQEKPVGKLNQDPHRTASAQADMGRQDDLSQDKKNPRQADRIRRRDQKPADESDPKHKLAIDADRQLDTETRRRIEQQLRRLPDDPGRLLRNKFYRAYQREHGTPPRRRDGG